MSGPHHIGKYPIEIHKGVDLSQMASARIAALEKVLREARRFVERDPTALTSSALLSRIKEVLLGPVGTSPR